jgi:hypothetical protein
VAGLQRRHLRGQVLLHAGDLLLLLPLPLQRRLQPLPQRLDLGLLRRLAARRLAGLAIGSARLRGRRAARLHLGLCCQGAPRTGAAVQAPGACVRAALGNPAAGRHRLSIMGMLRPHLLTQRGHLGRRLALLGQGALRGGRQLLLQAGAALLLELCLLQAAVRVLVCLCVWLGVWRGLAANGLQLCGV